MKKMVVKLEFQEEKVKQKAMQKVSGLAGVESISIDKDKKLTVTGSIDPVELVAKLRKICPTEIISVGPKDSGDKKKDDGKKDDGKKDDAKKDDNKKGDDKKKDNEVKAQIFPQYYNYPQHPYYQQQQYYAHPPAAYNNLSYGTVDENPNGCVIC